MADSNMNAKELSEELLKERVLTVQMIQRAQETLEADSLNELERKPGRYEELCREEIEFHKLKNSDYARFGDEYGNFDRVSKILESYKPDMSNPVWVALVYMLKQLDATMWMLSNEYEGAVENVASRLADVYCYAKIARVLHEQGGRNE